MYIPSLSTHPAVVHLFVKDYTLQAKLGAYAHERLHTQPVTLNVDVWVHQERPLEDTLENTLNYDTLVEQIQQTVDVGHIDLQETLVERIAQRLINAPGVLLVRVESQKPQAYVDARCRRVEYYLAHQERLDALAITL